MNMKQKIREYLKIIKYFEAIKVKDIKYTETFNTVVVVVGWGDSPLSRDEIVAHVNGILKKAPKSKYFILTPCCNCIDISTKYVDYEE